jgi:hypothetical protein
MPEKKFTDEELALACIRAAEESAHRRACGIWLRTEYELVRAREVRLRAAAARLRSIPGDLSTEDLRIVLSLASRYVSERGPSDEDALAVARVRLTLD